MVICGHKTTMNGEITVTVTSERGQQKWREKLLEERKRSVKEGGFHPADLAEVSSLHGGGTGTRAAPGAQSGVYLTGQTRSQKQPGEVGFLEVHLKDEGHSGSGFVWVVAVCVWCRRPRADDLMQMTSCR